MAEKITKEQVYDEEISPLMKQIIAICNKHNIANISTFSLDVDSGLCCTTCNIRDETEPPDKFKQIVDILYHKPAKPLMVTIDHGDGSQTVNAIL